MFSNEIETNIMSEAFQKKMREYLHDYFMARPASVVSISKEIGLSRPTIKKFLYGSRSLRPKESYIMLNFLQKNYVDL